MSPARKQVNDLLFLLALFFWFKLTLRAANRNRALLGDCDVCIFAAQIANSPLSKAKQVIMGSLVQAGQGEPKDRNPNEKIA